MTIVIKDFRSTIKNSFERDSGYFPVVATTNSEDIIIVYRAGAGHMGLGGRLELIRSNDGGLSWSNPVIVADSKLDDRNPSIGVTEDGIIIVAYHVNGNYRGERKYDGSLRNLHTCITRSKDGGRTWEQPYKLDLNAFDGFSPYGQMARFKDGSLILPIYGSKGWMEGKDDVVHSLLLKSSDKGLGWEEHGIIGKGLNEAAILALSEEKMMAVVRSESDNHMVVGFSQDAGRNWSSFRHLTKGHEHPACLTRLSEDFILLTYGHRSHPFGVRAIVSKDGGISWIRDKEIIIADDLRNGDCGYPSTMRLRDGRIVTAYYSTLFPPDEVDGWSCKGAKLHVIIYEENELLSHF